MIAIGCLRCQVGTTVTKLGDKKAEDFRCRKCGGKCEVVDLRWCRRCGRTEIAPGTELAALRCFVAPGATVCPKGHPFRPESKKSGTKRD